MGSTLRLSFAGLVLGLAAMFAAPARADVSVEEALSGLPAACGAPAPISRGWTNEPGLRVMLRVRAARRAAPPAPPPEEDADAEPAARMRPALHQCTLSPVPGQRVRL